MTEIKCPDCGSSDGERVAREPMKYDQYPYFYVCQECGCTFTYSYWVFLHPEPIILTEGKNER